MSEKNPDICEDETMKRFGYTSDKLSANSSKKVVVKCDYCGDFAEKRMDKYSRGKKEVAKNCCIKTECMKQKRQEVNLKRYGSTSPLGNKEVQAKIKNTMIERYGVEHPLQSKEIYNQMKETNIERYGCENVFQNEEIKTKSKETCLEKYGFDHFSKADALVPCDNLKVGDKKWRWIVKRVFVEESNGSLLTFCDVICECGNEAKVKMTAIVTGTSKSCGCYKAEIKSEECTERNSTHGMSNTRIYRIWGAIRTRCTNKNVPHWKNYGGRGITMCDDWINSFENFYEWSKLSNYDDKLSIDRIDNNKGYSPENCRWATAIEQCRNKRNSSTLIITAFGETKSVHEWVEDDRCVVTSIGALCYRIGAGWNPEEAITRNSERDYIKNKLRKVWNSIKSRCYNRNVKFYDRYGGRGIIMSDKWKENFLEFYDWSIKNGYEEGLSLDRINNDGNYEESNCKWVTAKEQAFNRSSTLHFNITAWDETKDIHEWVKDSRCVVEVKHICSRIGVGWTPERALSTVIESMI